MKKSIIGILIGLYLLPASFTAFAEGLDTRQWDKYCKAGKENKERCEAANQVCEQHPKADCDQIKLAFMQRRSLDAILAEDDDKK
jgi:hypothetical protein